MTPEEFDKLSKETEHLNRPGQYWKLDDKGEPRECTFAQWVAATERNIPSLRIVKQEWIENIEVSTVFLGINHSWGDNPPVLWETMTFSNRKDWDQQCDRCTGGREQAEAMHAEVCAKVREFLAKK